MILPVSQEVSRLLIKFGLLLNLPVCWHNFGFLGSILNKPARGANFRPRLLVHFTTVDRRARKCNSRGSALGQSQREGTRERRAERTLRTAEETRQEMKTRESSLAPVAVRPADANTPLLGVTAERMKRFDTTRTKHLATKYGALALVACVGAAAAFRPVDTLAAAAMACLSSPRRRLRDSRGPSCNGVCPSVVARDSTRIRRRDPRTSSCSAMAPTGPGTSPCNGISTTRLLRAPRRVRRPDRQLPPEQHAASAEPYKRGAACYEDAPCWHEKENEMAAAPPDIPALSRPRVRPPSNPTRRASRTSSPPSTVARSTGCLMTGSRSARKPTSSHPRRRPGRTPRARRVEGPGGGRGRMHGRVHCGCPRSPWSAQSSDRTFDANPRR